MYFYKFKTTIALCIWIFIKIYCRLKLKYAIIYVFLFNQFSDRPYFTMYHCTSMRTHVGICTCAQCHVCRCVRIMQIHIPMIAEVKVFQRQNMLYVHYMHTLVCRVFKSIYEQHLHGHTFIPTDIRFVPTIVVPLMFAIYRRI